MIPIAYLELWYLQTVTQYWNWGRYAADPLDSPLFSGDDFSLSGNGLSVPHRGIIVPGAPAPWKYAGPSRSIAPLTPQPVEDRRFEPLWSQC